MNIFLYVIVVFRFKIPRYCYSQYQKKSNHLLLYVVVIPEAIRNQLYTSSTVTGKVIC